MSGERGLLAFGWGGTIFAVFLPWTIASGRVAGETVAFGWALAPGRAVLLTALVTLGVMWMRRRKGRVTIEPLFSSLVLFGLGLWALVEARRQGLASGSGIALLFVASGSIGVSSLWTSLRRAWPSRGETRLRMAVLWRGTILRERTFDQEQTVTIGTEPGVTFIVPDDDAVRSVVPLLKAGLRGSTLRLPPDSFGRICLGGKETTVAVARQRHGAIPGKATEITLALGDWGLLHAGPLSVFFQQIVPARRVAAAFTPDSNVLASAATSTVFHVAMILCALFLWEEDGDLARTSPPFKNFSVDVAYVEEVEDLKETKETGEGTEGQADDDNVADLELADNIAEPDFKPMDRPETSTDKQTTRISGAPVPSPNPSAAGLAGLLQGRQRTGAVAAVIGGAGNLQDRIGQAMKGVGGTGGYAVSGNRLGPVGLGRGAGPGGDGMRRIGKIAFGGTIKTQLQRKKQHAVNRVTFKKGNTAGGCLKSDISRVVRRRARAFRHCFENALLSKPALSGPMTVRWTINLDGSTSQVTTRHNLGSQMGSCVARVIRRLRFSRPNGATCVVQWPFVFDGGAR